MMEHRVVVMCQCLGGRVKAEMGFGSCCCQANPLIYISHKNIYQEIKVCVYMCVCIPKIYIKNKQPPFMINHLFPSGAMEWAPPPGSLVVPSTSSRWTGTAPSDSVAMATSLVSGATPGSKPLLFRVRFSEVRLCFPPATCAACAKRLTNTREQPVTVHRSSACAMSVTPRDWRRVWPASTSSCRRTAALYPL